MAKHFHLEWEEMEDPFHSESLPKASLSQLEVITLSDLILNQSIKDMLPTLNLFPLEHTFL
jgi:hypothetical protein